MQLNKEKQTKQNEKTKKKKRKQKNKEKEKKTKYLQYISAYHLATNRDSLIRNRSLKLDA